MADAIVHIGFNKCGSTAIQKWLADSIPDLKRQGVFFQRTDPRPDVVCTNPHLSLLAYTLADQDAFAHPVHDVLGAPPGDRAAQDRVAMAFREKIETQAAEMPGRIFVFSCELLTARVLGDRPIAALVDWFRSVFVRVRAIVYIRRPEPWLVSLFGHEKLRDATQETLSDFVLRIRTASFASSLQSWNRALGPDLIDVRLFQEKWLSGTGLIADFVEALKVPGLLSGSDRSLINTGFQSTGRGLRSLISAALGRGKQRPSLSPDVSQAVRSANADDMDWIENTYFSADRDRFRGWLNATQET
ncbi:hypothetical protein [Antarctobacter sp.]|uniref:hypothetical protein n=1 Tax=Antarctobacter sp. TaxID=1872577 RepID=UPI003A8ECD35